MTMAAEETNFRDANGVPADGLPATDATSTSRRGSSGVTPSFPSATTSPAVGSPEEKTVISKRSPLLPEDVPLASAPHALGAALVGRRLEHYELNEFVGGGGMGAVFRATDTRLGRTVAVKVLSRDRTDEEM